MKRYFSLTLLLLSFGLAAQNYRGMDKRATSVPESETKSIKQLAVYLTSTARNDHEKARAIYVWLTNNITYSDTTVTNGWLGTNENYIQQQADNVLRNRTAVCEGFANLYKALCEEAGLRAEFVTGIVKDNGVVADVSHAWNAVQLGGQWYLSDPTWGSGYADYWTNEFVPKYQEEFFLILGEKMIQSHLPDDPIWQLLPNPLTEREFREFSEEQLKNRAVLQATRPFAFQDSITRWFALDSLQRMVAASERILLFNPNSSLALARLGSHYYNQALSTFFRTEEMIMQSLEDFKRELDTGEVLSRIELGERHLQKSWDYYARVTDPKLKLKIAAMPVQRAVAAEFEYLRGLLRVWKTIQLTHQLNTVGKSLPAGYLEDLHEEAERALGYLQRARNVYDDYTGELYHNVVLKSRIHEALVYNYLARADAFWYGRWKDLSEVQLQENLKGLDQAEAAFKKMDAIVNEVLKLDPASLFAKSFANEYPLGMASLQEDRGFIYMSLLEKKYAKEWQNPELINKKMATSMTADYQKSEGYYDRGMAYLKDCEANEESRDVAESLKVLKSNMHAYLGDIQPRLAANELKRIKTNTELRSKKKSLLDAYDEALRHYQLALDLAADNQHIRAQLLEMIDAVRATRKQIEDF